MIDENRREKKIELKGEQVIMSSGVGLVKVVVVKPVGEGPNDVDGRFIRGIKNFSMTMVQ